ncbi:MAG TPA: LytTR family DNA-binding domain-containing protein [Usitatibacter sp.]|nr:LytTR family DNA-binding domain-containing protein [Usitatibacter sp.]
MRSPTALIAEDEPALRAELRAHLARLWPELRVVAEAANGLEAIRLLGERVPDVLFLDIEMPGVTGLEVAGHAQGRCHVVFVTAYDEHAVAAFEQGAVDYVLKPFDVARLSLAVRRVEQRIGKSPVDIMAALKQLAADSTPRRYLRWICTSDRDESQLITIDDVCYFQSDTGYTRVVTAQGESLLRSPLKELQDQLDPAVFWQVHRSTIVNANAIAAVARDLRGRLTIRLKDRDEQLPVSEAHAHLFRQM